MMGLHRGPRSTLRKTLTAAPPVAALISFAGFLVAATPLWAAEGGSGNPWMDLLWKAVNFFALVALLVFFARKPVAGMFRNAAQGTREGLQGERERAQKAEAELAEQRSKIENLQAELQRLAGEAREEARAEHDRQIADARDQAERIKSAVQLQVGQEFNKARKTLQAELAQQTVQLAERMIREQMDDKGRERIATQAIDQLEGR